MKIGSVRGIALYIHWTFWLVPALYLFSIAGSHGLAAGLTAVAFILAVFACVLLHEFGHAAAAAGFGIPTSDITLLPIGGVARLSRIPDKPFQEFVIAVAGPAVNVVIAAALFLLIALGVVVSGSAPAIGNSMGFLTQLLWANIILVVFNMLPAFPMDGGRVLRSLIAMKTGHLRATEIAARLGRWMALAFGVYGLFTLQFILVLIAGFIFFAGTAELIGARMRAMGASGQQPFSGAWQQVYPGRATGFEWTNDQGQQGGWQQSGRPGNAYSQRSRFDDDDDVIDAVEVRRLD